MFKIKKSIVLFSIIVLLASCTENKNAELILGNWQATQWLVGGNPSNNNVNETSFSFDDKSAYTYNYAGTIVKGTYKVDNTSLYTTAEKEQEIMVNITKLTADSLTFEMNRGGQAETLILIKKK